MVLGCMVDGGFDWLGGVMLLLLRGRGRGGGRRWAGCDCHAGAIEEGGGMWMYL